MEPYSNGFNLKIYSMFFLLMTTQNLLKNQQNSLNIFTTEIMKWKDTLSLFGSIVRESIKLLLRKFIILWEKFQCTIKISSSQESYS